MQPQINEFCRNSGSKRRNRSVSESAGDCDASPSSRVRRLSGGSSSVALQNSGASTSLTQQKSYITHYQRNRAESFGSGRVGHGRRSHNSGSLSKPPESKADVPSKKDTPNVWGVTVRLRGITSSTEKQSRWLKLQKKAPMQYKKKFLSK